MSALGFIRDLLIIRRLFGPLFLPVFLNQQDVGLELLGAIFSSTTADCLRSQHRGNQDLKMKRKVCIVFVCACVCVRVCVRACVCVCSFELLDPSVPDV